MAKIHTANNSSKREAIQRAAVRLFRQKGYNATSMRHLAEAIGVEAASLYNHIDNKASLLRSICFEVAEAFTANIDSVENGDGPQAEKVERIIRFHIRMMMDSFEQVYVSNRDWKHLQEPYLSDFLEQRRSYEKRFAAVVEKGIRKKEFKQVDAGVAVLAILSAVRGIEYWQRGKTPIAAAAMENDLVTILTTGLQK